MSVIRAEFAQKYNCLYFILHIHLCADIVPLAVIFAPCFVRNQIKSTGITFEHNCSCFVNLGFSTSM